MSNIEPEVYYIPTTKYVPNNKLPVVIYRKVFTGPYDEDGVTEYLERHNWVKGGAWTAFTKPHCHTNCHECYGVYNGSSTLILGRGPYDTKKDGIEVQMERGDVLILPAGIAHSSDKLNKDYKFIGVYPDNGPKYEMNFCRDAAQTQDMVEMCEAVEPPTADPVFGEDGPLMDLWEAREQAV